MALLLKILRKAGVRLKGCPRFIAPSVFWDDFDKVTLGERTVISAKVVLLSHDYSYTTMLIASGEIPPQDKAIIRPIEIGNNVFVGLGSIIMPGTIIGDNVIIGAGSVVRGKVESDCILVGNPAKPIRSIGEQLAKINENKGCFGIRQD